MAALGLPPTWAPAPFTFAVAKLEQRTPTDLVTWHVLRIDTPLGVLGFAFTDDLARVLVDALQQQLTGVVIARDLPPTNGKGHLP
ncbi:MAG TPA: hypothetical protein VFO15_18040 [Xanthobacteraceae bacterium]|nr:hypothetical protein [Xanthobacteraceae bacterium]